MSSLYEGIWYTCMGWVQGILVLVHNLYLLAQSLYVLVSMTQYYVSCISHMHTHNPNQNTATNQILNQNFITKEHVLEEDPLPTLKELV